MNKEEIEKLFLHGNVTLVLRGNFRLSGRIEAVFDNSLKFVTEKKVSLIEINEITTIIGGK